MALLDRNPTLPVNQDRTAHYKLMSKVGRLMATPSNNMMATPSNNMMASSSNNMMASPSNTCVSDDTMIASPSKTPITITNDHFDAARAEPGPSQQDNGLSPYTANSIALPWSNGGTGSAQSQVQGVAGAQQQQQQPSQQQAQQQQPQRQQLPQHQQPSQREQPHQQPQQQVRQQAQHQQQQQVGSWTCSACGLSYFSDTCPRCSVANVGEVPSDFVGDVLRPLLNLLRMAQLYLVQLRPNQVQPDQIQAAIAGWLQYPVGVLFETALQLLIERDYQVRLARHQPLAQPHHRYQHEAVQHQAAQHGTEVGVGLKYWRSPEFPFPLSRQPHQAVQNQAVQHHHQYQHEAVQHQAIQHHQPPQHQLPEQQQTPKSVKSRLRFLALAQTLAPLVLQEKKETDKKLGSLGVTVDRLDEVLQSMMANLEEPARDRVRSSILKKKHVLLHQLHALGHDADDLKNRQEELILALETKNNPLSNATVLEALLGMFDEEEEAGGDLPVEDDLNDLDCLNQDLCMSDDEYM